MDVLVCLEATVDSDGALAREAAGAAVGTMLLGAWLAAGTGSLASCSKGLLSSAVTCGSAGRGVVMVSQSGEMESQCRLQCE